MKQGFTLIELIIAVTLAVLVMLAAVNVSTVMIRQHLQGIHKGEVNGMTMAALDSMNRDIEAATLVSTATVTAGSQNVIGGCTNWSSMGGGNGVGAKIDATQTVGYFVYCVDATRFGTLWKWSGSMATCPALAPTACSAAGTVNALTPSVLVKGDGLSYGLSYMDAQDLYFSRSRDTNGIELHYIVGNSTPTTDGTNSKPGQYIPQYYKIDMKVSSVKSYNNGAD